MRWLTVDPGDTTGWAVWEDTEYVDGGQTPNWEFVDLVEDALARPADERNPLVGIKRIVCEEFKIYPWKCKDLAFDPVMTAKIIGALMLLGRQHRVDFVLQDATIKDTAVAGGAEELFLEPVHPNRHHNDAVMHGVYYVQTELLNPLNARVENGRLVPR